MKSLETKVSVHNWFRSAEALAKEKGCLFSTIDTMDWEALDFYKKLGYEVELERRGFAKDTVMYGLRKDWV